MRLFFLGFWSDLNSSSPGFTHFVGLSGPNKKVPWTARPIRTFEMAEAMVPGRGAACGGFPWTTQQLGPKNLQKIWQRSSKDLQIFILDIIIDNNIIKHET